MFAARAKTGASGSQVWGDIRGLLTEAEARADTDSAVFPGPRPDGGRLWHPRLDARDVMELADGYGLLSWYQDLIQLGRTTTGIPLLGHHSYPGTGATPSMTIRQVQGSLYGWSLYEDVPYLIGCSSRTATILPSYAECGATIFSRIPGTPIRLHGPAAEEVVPLTLIPGRSPDVWMALFSNDYLLQEQVPLYNFAVRDPWLLRCEPGSTAPWCLGDADSDTFADRADCDDTSAAINPGVNVLTETSTDLNCDGWPRPL